MIDCVIFYLKTDMTDFDIIFDEAMKLKRRNLIQGYLPPNAVFEYMKEELKHAEWMQIRVESRFRYAAPSNMVKFKKTKLLNS